MIEEVHKNNINIPSVEKLEMGDTPELRGILKRVRGLYYKHLIAQESQGKKGELVTFDSLSEEDRDTFRYLQKYRGNRVPPNLSEFVEKIMKDAL